MGGGRGGSRRELGYFRVASVRIDISGIFICISGV